MVQEGYGDRMLDVCMFLGGANDIVPFDARRCDSDDTIKNINIDVYDNKTLDIPRCPQWS